VVVNSPAGNFSASKTNADPTSIPGMQLAHSSAGENSRLFFHAPESVPAERIQRTTHKMQLAGDWTARIFAKTTPSGAFCQPQKVS
jgi:hypothetical protein